MTTRRLAVPCRAITFLVVGLLAYSTSVRGDDLGWIDPPGWEDWFRSDDWLSYTIRGQNDTSGLIPTATQTAATERAPGFGRGLRRTTTTERYRGNSDGDNHVRSGCPPPPLRRPWKTSCQADLTLHQTPDVGSTIERSDSCADRQFPPEFAAVTRSIHPDLSRWRGVHECGRDVLGSHSTRLGLDDQPHRPVALPGSVDCPRPVRFAVRAGLSAS